MSEIFRAGSDSGMDSRFRQYQKKENNRSLYAVPQPISHVSNSGKTFFFCLSKYFVGCNMYRSSCTPAALPKENNIQFRCADKKRAQEYPPPPPPHPAAELDFQGWQWFGHGFEIRTVRAKTCVLPPQKMENNKSLYAYDHILNSYTAWESSL